MKKMKTTLIATVALAAGVMSSLAQNAKECTITFAVTGVKQTSVSTSPSAANAGLWSQGPLYYKTGPVKFTDQDIIKDIAFVLWGNAGHYTSTAKLILDQSELGGFFNITPDLAQSVAVVDGTQPEGTFDSADADASTVIANSFDSTFVVLDSGRHMTNNPITGLLPVGHMQPWGQIWVKDSAKDQYDNVTYFFALSVQECYDCFYLNSYVSSSTFKVESQAGNGPPCCSAATELVGKGVDTYYLTLSFDNTANNPYLFPDSSCYAGDDVGNGNVVGIGYPVSSSTIPGDAIVPDTINDPKTGDYIDAIKSGVGAPSPYEARFTLNGVVTYSWTLGFIDKSDASPDFLGTAKYACNGYGFIQLFCSILSGSASFTEKVVKASSTIDQLDNVTWSDWWYGVGAEYEPADTSSGYDTAYDLGFYLVPFNVAASLTYHQNFDVDYPSDSNKDGELSGTDYDFAPAAWPHSGYVAPLFYPVIFPN